MTKKNVTFDWTTRQQDSFNILKEKLCNPPILSYPNFDKIFTLTTDASNHGIGAVLSQEGQPCCFISRTLNSAEQNYTTTEKELLAIVWAIKRLRQYLLGRKFIIETDHQALKWLHNVKDPSSRLMRWRLRLEEYHYEINYKKGKQNLVADALSRMHPVTIRSNEPCTSKIVIRDLVKEFDDWKTRVTVRKIPVKLVANHSNWLQLDYNLMGNFNTLNWLRHLDKLTDTNEKTVSFGVYKLKLLDIIILKFMLQFICEKKTIEIIQLANEPPRVYSADEKLQILKENHDLTEHIGENKTLERIKQNFHWIGLDKDVSNYIKNCKICQMNKLTRIRPREEAIVTDTPEQPNDKIALDIIGPLNLTAKGNQYILSLQDTLTKYLMLIPIPDQKTETIIDKLINEYIYTFSSPKTILTDQAPYFISKLMGAFEKNFKIKHVRTTAFHPQSNGSLERAHAFVKDMLRTNMTETNADWDVNLKSISMAYNTTIHATTKFTPFELTFGHKANMPSTIATTPELDSSEVFLACKRQHEEYLAAAKRFTEENKRLHKLSQDKKIKIQNLYQLNDLVLLHNDNKTHKLDREWLGPYKILDIQTPNYLIEISSNKTALVHGNRLKLFYFSRDSQQSASQ